MATTRRNTGKPKRKYTKKRAKPATSILGTVIQGKIIDDRHVGAVHAATLVMDGDTDGGLAFLMNAVKGPLVDWGKWFDTLKQVFGVEIAKRVLHYILMQIGLGKKTFTVPFIGLKINLT
jgi:hypothetical protein